MDPLQTIRKMSNATTFAIYQRNKKRIVLLGDMHTPYEGENCVAPCNPPKCFDYIQLIQSLDTYHQKMGTDFDFYLETFSPHNSKSTWNHVKMSFLLYMSSVLRSILGQSIHLEEVRKEFIKKVYFHERKDVHQRYHYMDIRYDSLYKKNHMDMIELLKVMMNKDTIAIQKIVRTFYKHYPTCHSYIQQCKTICFGKKSNKISKQYHKLEAKDKKLVQHFFDQRMASVMKMFQKRWSEIATIKKSTHLILFFTMLLFSTGLLTDIYAICRFLRFFHRQPPGSTSLFLTGAAHSTNYIEFLKMWKARPIKKNQIAKKQSKCITL